MSEENTGVEHVEAALAAMCRGEMVIVVDDESRENEGDLTLAAQFATPEAINFMVTHARGLVCVALAPERCDELGLGPMVPRNTAPRETAFTVSVEAREGTTTGISAGDRARTVRVLCDPLCGKDDLVQPGHIFPLRAVRGGVLRRTGHTEAAVDLARLAGLQPAGVICEVMNEDGTMARRPDLEKFAKDHDLLMISVADLVSYRLAKDRLVHRVAEPVIPTLQGDWRMVCYKTDVDSKDHLALVMGEPDSSEDVLVRVHSECLTGDVFGSVRCDCGDQLKAAMDRIGEVGKGVIIYLRQEGRGIGLVDKLRAYTLQDEEGLDTVEANLKLGHLPDKRNYGIGAQILRDLGVIRIKYMTNNPHKFVALEGYGLTIVERVPLEVVTHEKARKYMRTKKEKLGHLLSDC